MDFKEITEKILERPRQEWPGVLNQIRIPADRAPDDIRQRLKEELTGREEKRSSGRFRRHISLAALVLLAITIPLFLIFRRGAIEDLPLQFVRGKGRILFAHHDRPVEHEPGARLKDGVRVVVPEGGRFYLRDDSGHLFEMNGPARLKISLQRRGDSAELRFEIVSGNVAVGSVTRGDAVVPSGAHPVAIVFLTGKTRLTLRGTIAGMDVAENHLRLDVLQGYFVAESSLFPHPVHIRDGESFSRGSGSGFILRSLKPREREWLADLKLRLDMVSRGEKPLDDSFRPVDEADIRLFYGRLQVVRLHDGRVFVGRAIKDERYTVIHTIDGIIRIKNGEIQSFSEVQSP